MTGYDFSIGDMVAYFGLLVGRVEYVGEGGWAGVRWGCGRLDEYPANMLHRCK